MLGIIVSLIHLQIHTVLKNVNNKALVQVEPQQTGSDSQQTLGVTKLQTTSET